MLLYFFKIELIFFKLINSLPRAIRRKAQKSDYERLQ